jgi:hypothetical protein
MLSYRLLLEDNLLCWLLLNHMLYGLLLNYILDGLLFDGLNNGWFLLLLYGFFEVGRGGLLVRHFRHSNLLGQIIECICVQLLIFVHDLDLVALSSGWSFFEQCLGCYVVCIASPWELVFVGSDRRINLPGCEGLLLLGCCETAFLWFRLRLQERLRW